MATRNSAKDTAHPYKGVTFYKRTGRWESNLWYMGSQHYLGASSTALEAARAYDKGILSTRTDLGQLNFDRSEYETDRQEREQMTFLQLRDHLRKTSRKTNCRIVNSKLKVLIDGNGKWEIKYRLKRPPTLKARYVFVGRFDTEQEALTAYNETAMLHDGHDATIRSFRSNQVESQVAGNRRKPDARSISQSVRRRSLTPRKPKGSAVCTIVKQVRNDSPNLHVPITEGFEVVSADQSIPQGKELQMPDLVGAPRSPLPEQRSSPELETSNSSPAALAASSEMQVGQNVCQLQFEFSAADLTKCMEEIFWREQIRSMEFAVDDQDSFQFSYSTSSTLPINVWSQEASRPSGSHIEAVSSSKTMNNLGGKGSFGIIDDLDLSLRL